VRYRYPFIQEAFNEVFFNLANFFFFFVYPLYQADKVYNRLIEYLSYIPRLASAKRNKRHAEDAIRQLIAQKTPFFVFPLQLQNDYQIRCSTRHARLNEPIRDTLSSFAKHAPVDAELVFKLHPLDNGLEHWERVIPGMAHEAGIGDRVRFVDGGDLALLLRHARGTVLLNSTVGIHALQVDCPVKVLGIATFDIPGLTSQCSLDTFWSEPQKPDPQLRDDFIKALAATVQVKGNFYTREGQARAIPEIAERLVTDKVNQPDGFVDPPPRLARAIAQGISGACNDVDCAPLRLPR
jgi:capsular polysaccharide export protein